MLKKYRKVLYGVAGLLMALSLQRAESKQNSPDIPPERFCFREIGTELVKNITERLSRFPQAQSAEVIRSRLENLDLWAREGFEPLYIDFEPVRLLSTGTIAYRVEGALEIGAGQGELWARYCAEVRVEQDGSCTVLRFQPRSAEPHPLEINLLRREVIINCYSSGMDPPSQEPDSTQNLERALRLFQNLQENRDGKR